MGWLRRDAVVCFVVSVGAFMLALPLFAGAVVTTGSGTLSVNPGGTNGTCDQNGSGFSDFHPHDQSLGFWDVKQNDMNWLNITAGFKICKGGSPAAENTPCSTANQCNTNAQNVCDQDATGTCTAGNVGASCSADNGCNVSGVCTGGTCTVGKVGQSCSNGNQCNLSGTCTKPRHCEAGSPRNAGALCTSDNDCNYTTGACSVALECSGSTNVVISGHTGTACTQDSDCSAGNGETTCHLACVGGNKEGQLCTSNSDCTGNGSCSGPGLCRFADQVAGTVAKKCTNDASSCTTDANCSNGGKCVDQISICYATRSNTCSTADVSYCGNFLVNANDPPQSQTFKFVSLRTVDNYDENECTQDSDCGPNGKCVGGNPKRCESPLNTATACVPPVTTCKNEIGSYCCSLSQGAYGSPNSVATSLGTPVNNNQCENTGLGFIPAAICQGDNPFNLLLGVNATTIGSITTGKNVTVADLTTLQAYLPAGGTAGPLSANSLPKLYSAGIITPPTNNVSGSGSKGNGAGVLAGQTMACSINAFLSSAAPPFGGSSTFTAPGFKDFTLPTTNAFVCTKRSGPDKVLGTLDDICEAFAYPNCASGLTVNQVINCANQVLGGESPASCSCTANDLNVALSNINVEFDQCGNVVECKDYYGATVNTPGAFFCPTGP